MAHLLSAEPPCLSGMTLLNIRTAVTSSPKGKKILAERMELPGVVLSQLVFSFLGQHRSEAQKLRADIMALGLRRIRKPLRQCSWVHSFPWKENYFPYRIIFSIGAVVLLHGEEGAVSAGGDLQEDPFSWRSAVEE